MYPNRARGYLCTPAQQSWVCKKLVGIVECLDSHFYEDGFYAIRIGIWNFKPASV